MSLELLCEFRPAVAPRQGEAKVIFQYTLFEPFQRCLLQVADREEDFGSVCCILLRV